MAKAKLRPVLDGDWWLIGPSPDLSGLVPGAEEHKSAWDAGGKQGEHNAPVDHHAFQGPDGRWHLWGCVRATAVGRVFYHWEAGDLTESPWRPTREIIRCDRDAGECVDDWNGQEWLQSPYFVCHDGTHYMFYGGHLSAFERDASDLPGGDTDRACQICLMTSTNGRDWTRHENSDGLSHLFLGPGETRDPCVIRINGTWYMYYAGYYDHERPDEGAGFVVRTSEDLVHWSDWKLVHSDPAFGKGRCDAECPHVVFRDGYYYMFRTQDYYAALTHVFRSEDPYDFGIGDASDKYVGVFPAAAVEVYVDGCGNEYVSSNHDPRLGTQMCRLKWESA